MRISKEKLKRIADVRLLDNAELAKMAGVSPQTICNWINGTVKPRVRNVRSLVNALKIKPSQIMETK